MLNCKISKSNSNSCDTSVSGVLKMAIANWSSDYSFTASGTGCAIDTIDLDDANFYELFFSEGSGFANANLNAGASVDQKSILHSVGGVISHIDCDLITDWKNYLLGRVIFAVLTKNGDTYIFGANNGLNAVNWDYTTGTADTDAQGITFQFDGAQKDAPLLVKDWATIEALFPKTPGNGG